MCTSVFSAGQNTKCFSLHYWRIHKSQWFMLRGFSISHLPFLPIIWKRILLAAQMITPLLTASQAETMINEQMCAWVLVAWSDIFSASEKQPTLRYIIQSACAHTWSRDLVNQCRSVSVVCLPICFCPSLHLQQVAAILKSWLWVQAIGAI